jgi:uroporphyrinogen decarboxylase
MKHISEQIANYLMFQVDSGVHAVQIFDSWVGILSQSEYAEFILPHMQTLIAKVKTKNVPVILYSQPTTHLIELMGQTGANALSVDWRSSLYDLSRKLPQNISLQGNLDPIVTTLDWTQAKPYVEKVMHDAARAEILDRYIFNVGHGVTPQTNTDTLANIIDYVHNFK